MPILNEQTNLLFFWLKYFQPIQSQKIYAIYLWTFWLYLFNINSGSFLPSWVFDLCQGSMYGVLMLFTTVCSPVYLWYVSSRLCLDAIEDSVTQTDCLSLCLSLLMIPAANGWWFAPPKLIRPTIPHNEMIKSGDHFNIVCMKALSWGGNRVSRPSWKKMKAKHSSE